MVWPYCLPLRRTTGCEEGFRFCYGLEDVENFRDVNAFPQGADLWSQFDEGDRGFMLADSCIGANHLAQAGRVAMRNSAEIEDYRPYAGFEQSSDLRTKREQRLVKHQPSRELDDDGPVAGL